MDKSSVLAKLYVLTTLLDSLGNDLRTLDPDNSSEYYEKVGEALATLFEIEQRLELKWGGSGPPHALNGSESNRRLGVALVEAHTLAKAGHLEDAQARLIAVLDQEDSDMHREIALDELTQIRKRYDNL